MLKRFIKLTPILAMPLLFGCNQTTQVKADVAKANFEIIKEQIKMFEKPILDVEIPQAGGADPIKIVVRNPQSGQYQQIAMPDDPWARVVDRGMGVLGTAAGIYLGGEAAKGLVTATGGAISGALSYQPDPVVVNPATPIVVTQPDPVVVNTPDPVVVDPVIVDPVVIEK